MRMATGISLLATLFLSASVAAQNATYVGLTETAQAVLRSPSRTQIAMFEIHPVKSSDFSIIASADQKKLQPIDLTMNGGDARNFGRISPEAAAPEQ